VSATFVTYLWHYLAARAIYDELLRPLMHGRPWVLLFVAGVAALAFAVGRWSGRRSPTQRGRTLRRRA
jgi:hypothetical protein